MSYDGYDDDNDDFDNDSSNPLRALRKENRAKEKQIKELQEQLQSLSKATRERSLADVLTARGLPSKIAKFIPEDVTSEEDVASWLDEYGDVFGASSSAPEQSAPADENAEVLSALQKIASTQSTGQAPTGDQSQIAALIAGARTPEELNKVLFGNEHGPAAI
jgi:hypothetical protein